MPITSEQANGVYASRGETACEPRTPYGDSVCGKRPLFAAGSRTGESLSAIRYYRYAPTCAVRYEYSADTYVDASID